MLTLVLALTTGALAGGATERLPEAPGLLDRWDADRSWGTPLIVDTLLHATRRMAWENPHLDPVTVGDLSVRGGGPMFGHSTHDEGIDADLGLFVRGGRQPDGFTDVTADDLDAEATWKLIATLLDTENVQFILLDQGHIDRIRGWLASTGYPQEAIDAVFVPTGTRLTWDRRGVVRHAPNHRSHLHVRVTPPPPAVPLN
ncbi:MAG: penicillin-insensitive murein endopeptidase [Alphaproteobacteria bacterium]|nr:penicillin-insensitive murein endopeptidase [Alphaproteobacteria bacterium]MCB9693990.1 penicillin-insensitive murein endopeptidase [Alphaproteobacteria bacterium]